MITTRTYRDEDAASVGRLIASTYSAFNLGFATPDQQASLLGPFRFAESAERAHRAAIAEALGAPMVLVAEEAGAIVGVLQGDPAFLHMCVTDVRDVGRAHVLAAQKGEHGRRYLVVGDVMSPAQLRDAYGRIAGVTPATFTPPRFLLNFLAGRMEKVAAATGGDANLTRALVKDAVGKHLVYEGSRSRAELGATYRGGDEVIRDALRWVLFMGALKPKVDAKVRRAMGAAAEPDPDWTK